MEKVAEKLVARQLKKLNSRAIARKQVEERKFERDCEPIG